MSSAKAAKGGVGTSHCLSLSRLDGVLSGPGQAEKGDLRGEKGVGWRGKVHGTDFFLDVSVLQATSFPPHPK